MILKKTQATNPTITKLNQQEKYSIGDLLYQFT